MSFSRLIFLVLLPLAKAAAAPPDSIGGFVAEYCLECHDALSEKGGLDLEPLLDAEVGAAAGTWEKVLRQIDARQMPPVGKDRPEEGDYESTVAALASALDKAFTGAIRPGRVPAIRRLTRTEYANAIRDLFGIEIDAEEWLPADDPSHGFDNQTLGELSPTRFDRYVSAAGRLARLAVGSAPSEPETRVVRVRPDITQEHRLHGMPPGTRGGTTWNHFFPRDGDYEVSVRLTRDRNGMVEGLDRPHRIEVLIDGVPMGEIEVKPPRKRSDHNDVDNALKLIVAAKAGASELTVTFREDDSSVVETMRQPYESRFNYHRHPRLSPALYHVSVTGPLVDRGTGETSPRERWLAHRPGAEEEAGEVARKNLLPLLRLAWRRPVEPGEIESVAAFFDQAYAEDDDFDGGMEAALAAVLVSPEFLFRIERGMGEASEDGVRKLDSYELASRLSFFLWSSIPDERLLGEVKEGTVDLERLLSDPRAAALTDNFADQWLHLRNLDSVTPDGRLFPDFDHNLRMAFAEETKALFRRVVAEDRSVLDLLTSEEAWVDERLAKHYGIDGVRGSRFRWVPLAEGVPRGGLLRNGSVLMATSYATRTSPVIRGNWILENLIGTPPPPPPPDVPALEDNHVDPDLPLRQRLAAHREAAACASCHDLIDPVGFALENFDAVGRWRATENGHPVDAGGALPTTVAFDGVAGLEAGLAARPDLFVRTLVEKLMNYALGRGIEPEDGPTVRRIVREAAPDYRFSSLVEGIVESDAFRYRQDDLVEP